MCESLWNVHSLYRGNDNDRTNGVRFQVNLERLMAQDPNRYYDEDGNAYLLFSMREILALQRLIAVQRFVKQMR